MLLGFQAVWFACAWGIGNGYPWLPLIASLAYLGFYISRQTEKKWVYLFLLKIFALGFVVDSLISGLGLMIFQSAYPQPLEGFQPWWLSLLWLSFGASAKACFFWLEKRPFLALVLGAISGPVAYFSGLQLGAFVAIYWQGYILLSIAYAGVMILLIKLIRIQPSYVK